MRDTDLLIVGGGMAGLSVGCYARMNGWSTHILEHGAELGGMCTAWERDPYVFDGCIQWLLGGGEGGNFRQVYEELGVIRDVPLRRLDVLSRYEDARDGWGVDVGSDVEHLRRAMIERAPEDAEEIGRLVEAIEAMRDFHFDVDRPPELTSLADRFRSLLEMRHLAGTILHFRGSLGEWCNGHLRSGPLRDFLGTVMAPEMPMVILPALLASLAEGQLHRPVGGSGAFRDAIVRRYHALGGVSQLNTTVEEILVEGDRAVGVRLTDGTQLRSGIVVSTSSAYETSLRLLGGRFVDSSTRKRLDTWPKFQPIVLLSLGVEAPLTDLPPALVLRQSVPLVVGGRANDAFYVRVCNDEPAFAPEGHCVVQATVGTDYDWWAERGPRYGSEKAAAARSIVDRIEHRVPGLGQAVAVTDVATPLTFWRHGRAWRGAYEGWLPTPHTFMTHVPKTIPGLKGLYLAGQWVEPGGGIPPSLMSGRQLVQILCDEHHVEFETGATV